MDEEWNERKKSILMDLQQFFLWKCVDVVSVNFFERGCRRVGGGVFVHSFSTVSVNRFWVNFCCCCEIGTCTE